MVTSHLTRKLHVSNQVVPKLSRLAEINKPVVVSVIGTPTYNFAQWLTKKLEEFPFAEANLFRKNSLHFNESVKNRSLQQGKFLISIDVTSLFSIVTVFQYLVFTQNP